MRKIAVTAVLASLVMLSGHAALAQQTQDETKEKAAPGAPAAAPKVKVERSASGAKVFRITEGIVVEGRIQKPNAFYVLQRSSIDYEWETLNQGFLPRILQATGQSPF